MKSSTFFESILADGAKSTKEEKMFQKLGILGILRYIMGVLDGQMSMG